MGARAHIGHEANGKSFGTLPTAIGTVTRLAHAAVRSAGLDPAPLLRKAGLTERQVEDRAMRLDVHHQIRFVGMAADAVGDPFFGFHLAQRANLRELGFLYYVAASSERLGDAMRRAARYSSVANEGLFVKYVGGTDVTLAFDYVGVPRHIDRHQMEFCMAVAMRLGRELTGLQLPATRVTLIHHRNDDCTELAAFFGCAIDSGAGADAFTLPATSADLPLASADPFLNKLLIANCEEALTRRAGRRRSFRSDVENAIVQLLPHGKARAGEVAEKLGLGERTFARRLGLEGLTFSEVLEALRADLAKQYLSDDGLSVSQVAWLLGYQEVSAFTHAFKRWTGMTPRAARARDGVEPRSWSRP